MSAAAPSPKPNRKRDRTAAERMRRYRQRLQQDIMVFREFAVDVAMREALIERGYLSQRDEDDPEQVKKALLDLIFGKCPLCSQKQTKTGELRNVSK